MGNAENHLASGAESQAAIEEMLLASTLVGDTRQCIFSVPDISCGGCIQRIEKTLQSLPGVINTRVNLTHRRVTVQWSDSAVAPAIATQLSAIGYTSHLVRDETKNNDGHFPYLLRALAVAAFASGNIMLLSVSVWSGADAHTNQLFHWVSAIIALPAIAYSGQVFFSSAWRAVRNRTTNMDVPISIGILLALALSCYDTLRNTDGVSVYFEAPVMLVFFLLMGRTLDYIMRDKVRKAADGLAKLEPSGAWVADEESGKRYKQLGDISVGDEIFIAANEAVAVDCTVTHGTSDLDSSLVSGESEPRSVGAGDHLLAGTRNLTSALQAKVTATASESHLAQMIELIRSAEQTRSNSRGLADRVSALYAPVVHSVAFLSFIGWYMATRDIHQSVTIAVAVLIITCPCALGLAVPMVQVVVARKMFESGILLKNALALERLAKIDTVVFDKTGTLTAGEPQLVNSNQVEDKYLQIAASMALSSNHPYSRALRQAFVNRQIDDSTGASAPAGDVSEVPGLGLEMFVGGHTYKLGKPQWAIANYSGSTFENPNTSGSISSVDHSQTVLSIDGTVQASFLFEDKLRKGAQACVDQLRVHGIEVECLSGDSSSTVMKCADQLGIDKYKAEQLPAEKADYLESMAVVGRRVLMVGDGLNDAPALTVAYVSMAPGAASEVGRNSADIVFTGNKLSAVTEALMWSRVAARSTRQNLTFALLYNSLALPLAVAGLVTPLLAALAMSASSLVVVCNSLLINTSSTTDKSTNPSLTTPVRTLAMGG